MRAVAVIVVATLLWSCGGEDTPAPEASPPASPTPTEVAGAGTRYGSIEALAADLEERGLACSDLKYLEQENPTLKEFALCDPNQDPNQRLNIYLFKNSARRDQWIGSIVQSGLPWIFGPNWIIVGAGEPATAEQRLEVVRDAIGGQIANVEF